MAGGATLLRAQEGRLPVFRIKVDMVVLSFQVTDSKNHYINGLKPSDFRIYEDGILQKVATFAEGANAPLSVAEDGSDPSAARSQEGRAAGHGPAGRLHRHQRLRSLRHQQLHVPRLRLCRGRHRRFRARPGPRRFGGGLHLQPQSLARRDPDARAWRGHLGPAQGRGRRRYGALQRPAADAPRRRQGAGPQGGDRVLQRSGQRQHGGARTTSARWPKTKGFRST